MNKHPRDILLEVNARLSFLHELMCDGGRKPDTGWVLSTEALAGLAYITGDCVERIRMAQRALVCEM